MDGNDRTLQIIFPEGLPNNLQDNPELLKYLEKLGNYKVENLKREQSRISEEHKQIVEQTQELAVQNYKTFIQTAEKSKELSKDFEETEKQVDELLEKFPKCEENCKDFFAKSSETIEKRRLNALTLKKNSQLLEILELPELMEKCVDEEKFEEALELAFHVHRMGVKQVNIPIIQRIVSIVDSHWHKMLLKLLDQLKTDLQLPKCLQIVGYLRRMKAFDNKELKLKYLQARDAWLNKCLEGIPKDNAQQHLTKTIEVTRVNLFNIITQYKAIFPDDPNQKAQETDGGRIFESWINRKINSFLEVLEEDLSSGVSSMDTILGQCMYFGQSFGRVGADFRGLMVPIFLNVISKNVSNSITKVNQTFRANLEKFTLVNKVNYSLLNRKSEDPSEQLSPPETLLDFQPLAVLCNGYLEVLNELRLCAPVALVFDVTKCFQESLEFVAQQIFYFYRTEKPKFYGGEKENFIKFASCFAYDLIPYVQRCLNAIFSQEMIALNLGVSLTVLHSEGIGVIKQKVILEPLKELLPNKVDLLMMQESIVGGGSAIVG
ncbi:COG8 family protein [Megaselia abdita]